MGISYDAMTYVGVYAGDTKIDAENYLVHRGLLDIGELDSKYGGDIQELYFIDVQCENYYSGRGYYIGFETHVSDYKYFDCLIDKFKELTGDEAEVITFVQVN